MNINNWKLDLFSALDAAHSVHTIMKASLNAIRPFGFDFCGWRTNTQYSSMYQPSRVVAFNAIEDQALKKIAEGECDSAPVPRHCARSDAPIVWRGSTDDLIFLQSPTLWEDYYSTGHRGGWAVATTSYNGEKGIFFVESQNVLSPAEMYYAEQHMRWVSAAAYVRVEELQHESKAMRLTPQERKLLQQLYQHNASIPLLLCHCVLSKAYVYYMINRLYKKTGCNNVHSLIAHALFLGWIA